MYHFGGSQPVSSLGIFSGRVQGSSSKPRVRNPSSPLRPPTAHRHSWRNPGHFAHRARNSQERQTRWRREMDSNYWSRQGRSPVWARHIVSGPLRPPSAKFPRETDSLAERCGFKLVVPQFSSYCARPASVRRISARRSKDLDGFFRQGRL